MLENVVRSLNSWLMKLVTSTTMPPDVVDPGAWSCDRAGRLAHRERVARSKGRGLSWSLRRLLRSVGTFGKRRSSGTAWRSSSGSVKGGRARRCYVLSCVKHVHFALLPDASSRTDGRPLSATQQTAHCDCVLARSRLPASHHRCRRAWRMAIALLHGAPRCTVRAAPQPNLSPCSSRIVAAAVQSVAFAASP